MWKSSLVDFETSNSDWQLPFTILRYEPDYPENFAFLHENVLFIIINFVEGKIHNEDEWAARQAGDLAWIDSNVNENRNEFSRMVVFAHADPDIQSNKPFYHPFLIKCETRITSKCP
jgi:hypothetical protein